MLRPFPTQKVEIEMERQFKLQNFNSKPKHNEACLRNEYCMDHSRCFTVIL